MDLLDEHKHMELIKADELTELLEVLRAKIERRNAEDFLASFIEHWDGYFGDWLVKGQMQLDCVNGEHSHLPPDVFPEEFD